MDSGLGFGGESSLSTGMSVDDDWSTQNIEF